MGEPTHQVVVLVFLIEASLPVFLYIPDLGNGRRDIKWTARIPFNEVTHKLHTSLRLPSLWPDLCNMASWF
jgi:hypothetical protein